MKQKLPIIVILLVTIFFSSKLSAQKDVTVTFGLKSGDVESPEFSDPDSFDSGTFSWGSDLSIAAFNYFDNGFSRFTNSGSNISVVSETQAVTFVFKPKAGLYFTPTSVSLRALRCGTDKGFVTVKCKSGDKKEITLGGSQPNRNNDKYSSYSVFDFDVTKVDPSFNEFYVIVYCTDFDATKSFAISDLVIEGSISDTFIPLDPTKPEVTKKGFDFIVPLDGDYKKAIDEANNRSNTNSRYYIFVEDGSYHLGDTIGSFLSAPNVSIIGQSTENTYIRNNPKLEGISMTATMQMTKNAQNTYIQDVTFKNDYPYNSTTGRAVCIQDRGNKNIFKNVRLLSYQDTYYTNNNSMRCYWEDGEIHGTVDFICGGGDVFFNNCLLYLESRNGNVITAHTVASRNYGYVFNNCTIDGASLCDNNYRLGRNWGAEARAIYLNTTMNLIPASDGWSQMNNDNQPAWFGEYKSVDKSGNPVDCSNRKKTFCSSSVSYNTVLTDAQAAEFTIENVIGGDDDWEPNVYTEQLLAPFIQIENNVISWTENKYALCWGIFRNGKIVEFVTENSYAVPVGNEGAVYTVRAANEYGGLSETSNKVTAVETVVDAEIDSAVNNTVNEKTVVDEKYISVDGKVYSNPVKGVNIVKRTMNDGSVEMINVFVK